MSVILVENVKSYAKVANSFIKFKKNLEGHMWSTNKNYNEVYNLTYFLYLANIESYNNRYEDNKAEVLYSKEEFLKELNNTPIETYENIYQYLKALEFLAYQIEITNSENNKINEAIKFLKSIIQGIYSYVISKNEEYSKASWGL